MVRRSNFQFTRYRNYLWISRVLVLQTVQIVGITFFSICFSFVVNYAGWSSINRCVSMWWEWLYLCVERVDCEWPDRRNWWEIYHWVRLVVPLGCLALLGLGLALHLPFLSSLCRELFPLCFCPTSYSSPLLSFSVFLSKLHICCESRLQIFRSLCLHRFVFAFGFHLAQAACSQ